MFDWNKPVLVIPSALRHGLEDGFIKRMWYDESCEGFEVARMPPQETNVIAIRYLSRPDGILEMIAEDTQRCYVIFHAQIVPEGKATSLIRGAFSLLGKG